MKFFIITVCRDGAKFLPQCVGSVLSQARADWTMDKAFYLLEVALKSAGVL